MIEGRPTAKEMGLDEEFVYATRIVDTILKVNLNDNCVKSDVIRAIEKTFLEYKSKILETTLYK